MASVVIRSFHDDRARTFARKPRQCFMNTPPPASKAQCDQGPRELSQKCPKVTRASPQAWSGPIASCLRVFFPEPEKIKSSYFAFPHSLVSRKITAQFAFNKKISRAVLVLRDNVPLTEDWVVLKAIFLSALFCLAGSVLLSAQDGSKQDSSKDDTFTLTVAPPTSANEVQVRYVF